MALVGSAVSLAPVPRIDIKHIIEWNVAVITSHVKNTVNDPTSNCCWSNISLISLPRPGSIKSSPAAKCSLTSSAGMGSKLLPNVWGLLASLLCGCWPNDPLRTFSEFDELGVAEEMSSNSVQR